MSQEFDVAIVGMSCRFPGAASVAEFWRNLAGGVESIARLSDQEILASGVPRAQLENPSYVKAAPVLDGPGQFDAAFFGYSPMEAASMDPQQRILLELAYAALEDAGYDPERYRGRVGVFAGSAMNTYFANVGLHGRFAEEYIPTLIGNDKDFLATRISYKLNLRGPSLTVQTACSTSLVAIHLARQSLLTQETDMALAGAISVRVPHRAGYFYDGGGVVSPDGHVRAFDAGANGTVFGSGGGVLVLKRLADALSDGDTVHAVIKGSAVNNDGAGKAGYTAPSVNSQADAVVEALANAGVDADSITYLEAHGSGTPVGDPIEVMALTKAFRTSTQRSGYCAIGSAKTNIGHLDAAAGIAGMIKTVLALKHRQLVPSLHYQKANPEIDFPATPFYVNTALRDWASDGPRRAGVMATGMGGTNAHVVLEEAPQPEARADDARAQLLIVSAKTPAALDRATDRLREFLAGDERLNVSDVAHTLKVGRKAFAHRRALVCGSREDAVAALLARDPKRILSARTEQGSRPVIFLLPGVGDHYVGMAHGLYESWPVFREEMDRCAQLLQPHLGADLRSAIYPESQSWKKQGKSKGIDLRKMLAARGDAPEDPEASRLNQTLFAQPALFTIEYAIARLWQSLGVVPDAIVGHSMGEYVAACLAGVMSLEDALRLVAIRARLVNELPQGALLAVMLPEDELRPLLDERLSISLINGPKLCIVAGPEAAVSEFEAALGRRGAICRRVQSAHAFHSRMLDPIVQAYEAQVRKVALREPRIPYTSNVSGTWITAREATDPAYWARHANHTARFNDALQQLWQHQNPILLEAGPGRTLGVLAMQHPARERGADPVTVSSVRHHYENEPDVEFLLQNMARVWLAGAQIDWEKAPRAARRVSLPTYPFEKDEHWLGAASLRSREARQPAASGAASPVDEWFYTPTWQRAPLPSGTEAADSATLWLVISDRSGGGATICARLRQRGLRAEFARFGTRFSRAADGAYEVNPAGIDDYMALLRELQGASPERINIVHLGGFSADRPAAGAKSSQDFGFYSLLHIAQAIGELELKRPMRIGVISNRLHAVTGEESLDPTMAPLLGPCGVIPKEFPNVRCFSIDLPDRGAVDELSDRTLASLVSEFDAANEDRVIAYRGRYRWKRAYEQVRLARSVETGRLRRGGVYLITGGTGGLGLVIAKYLAEACQPKLVLTKKTAFPEKAKWRALAAAPDTPASERRTLAALLELEDLGAEVEVRVAEASNLEQMRKVVQDTLASRGAIHGVVHAAGIVRAGLIQAKTRETAHSVLAPKVDGTAILFELLKDANPDFLILFSSITSVLAPYAESDYSGANAFLDVFAGYANAARPFRTVAINWPGWKEVGQLADLESLQGVEGWKESALKKAIATKDGLEAFKRVLHSNLEQVVVSPENLGELLAEYQAPFDPAQYLVQIKDSRAARAGPKGALAEADRPVSEVETALAAIWGEVLGLEQIAIQEDFARLGGHSLLALQIVSRIRSSFQINFTLREFFEAPTIARLAVAIENRVAAEIDSLSDEEVRRLVSAERGS